MAPTTFQLPFWTSQSTTQSSRPPVTKIEDYPSGYPRFSALLAAQPSFLIYRRFNRLRARLLLLKQDKISQLEEQLDQIDRNEPALLFLGKSRYDTNAQRASVLAEIESRLADYDQCVERAMRTLAANPAEIRDVSSLQNWLDGTGCIAREEVAYLNHSRELFTLAPACDTALQQLEVWVENKIIRFYRNFRRGPHHYVSTDENVYIYDGSLIKQTARALLIFLITSLLLVPVVVCNAVSNISVRIAVIMISTVVYLMILSMLTRSRTMELTLAGATYATILIVFISGTKPM